jgi:hypothetical protein
MRITNLQEAIDYYIPFFEGMELIPEAKDVDTFASYCHSQLSGGIGMNIRNHLDLWNDKSILHIYFKKEYKCDHPDNMSDLVIRGVYEKIKK